MQAGDDGETSVNDIWFIHLKQIIINNPQQAQSTELERIRIVIKHEHGTEESFQNGRNTLTIDCNTFVRLDSEKSKIWMIRRQKFNADAEDRQPRGILSKIKIKMPRKLRVRTSTSSTTMSATLVFGETKTASSVISTRCDEMEKLLDKEETAMNEISVVTDRLRFVIDMGCAIAEVNPYSKAVFAVIKTLFNRVREGPAIYGKLRRAALECIHEAKFDEEARSVFKSKAVQDGMRDVQDSVFKAFDLISSYFDEGRPSPSQGDVDSLIEKMMAQKAHLTQMFMVENKTDIDKLLRDDENKLLEKLSPPKETHSRSKCLSNTRITILDTITTWVQKSSEASRLFLLYGVAGCGKSSVAGTICDALGESERLTGHFFCAQDDTERRSPTRLMQTLAYYLAFKDTPYREVLLQELKTPQSQLHVVKDLETHFKLLLDEPLRKVQHLDHHPAVFVIDALDECEQDKDVSRCLVTIVRLAPWIRIIVTSRNVSGIRDQISVLSESQVSHDLFDYSAEDDIRHFLRHQLLRREGFSVVADYLSEDDIEALVKKADGLFIWIHVVVEFISRMRVGKVEKIKEILAGTTCKHEQERLDTIYTTVLDKAAGSDEEGKEVVRHILGFVSAASSVAPFSVNTLFAFLPARMHVSFREYKEILEILRAILVISDDGTIRAFHASLLDFAASEERCGKEFFMPAQEIHGIIAAGCFEIMQHGTRKPGRQQKQKARSGLHFNMCKLESSHLEDSRVLDLEQHIADNISPELLYSCTYWFDHAMRAGLDGRVSRSRSSVLVSLSKAIRSLLCSIRSLFLFEVMNLCGRMDAARGALLRVHSLQLDTAESTTLIRKVAHETSLFIEQCLPAISISTPHLYLSLTWIASESKLWTCWQSEFSRAQILTRPLCYSPGRRLLSFDCPPRVDTFSMSPDGQYLASGSRDGHVRVRNLASGSGVVVSESQLNANHFGDSQTSPPIDALAYRPDGRSILCASGSSIVDLDSSTLLTARKATTIDYSGIRCIAVSIEPQHVAIGLEDGTIAILDAVTLSTVRQWKEHRGTVCAIAFDRNGLHLASASSDWRVRVWDVQSGEHIKDMKIMWSVCSMAFSSDGKRVVSGGSDGNVRVFDAESGEQIGESWEAGSYVRFLAFSPDDSRIVTAVASKEYFWAEQTSIQIWDANVLTRQTTSSPGHTDRVNSVAFSPDGKRIVSGSSDCSVRVWDAETGEPVELAEMQHYDPIIFVAFSPDGTHIASGGYNNDIRIWDVRTGNPIRELEGHTDWVTYSAYSPDGTKIVSSSEDQTLRLWDASSGEQIGQAMAGHKDWINAVCFSPDGSCIASASWDSTIRLWDGRTGEALLGEPLIGHDGKVNCITFSPDGNRLASGGDDKTVRLWDAEKRTCIDEPLKGHSNIVTSVTFSPDGAFVFSSSHDKTIRCWDASTGEPVDHQLIGHTDTIRSLAISKDGTRIVTGSWDKTIRVWDSKALHWETDQSLAKCGLRGPDRIPAHIPDDGWIRTTNSGLLLWVPPEHRKVVCDTNLFCMSTDDSEKPIRILWDELRHGVDWTTVCSAS